MGHRAGWCLTGIALLAAFTRVLTEVSGTGVMALGIPLVLVALGLVVSGSLCAVGAPLLWLNARLAGFRAGALRVDNGIVLEENGFRTVLPLVLVTAATVSPLEDELLVHTRDGDVIRAKVSGLDDARAIVESLAVSKVHGTWLSSLHRREAAPRWVQWAWLSAFAVGLMTFLVTLPITKADLALAIGTLAFGVTRFGASSAKNPGVTGSIVIGKDGLAMKQGTIDRFIAFGEIERVDGTAAGASLLLTSGEEVAVDILPALPPAAEPQGSLTAVLHEARHAQLLALLREGLLPEGTELVRAGALLERRGRTVRAWREALSELVREAAGGYRTAALPKEQALAVLEDGHASSELRIGAALALTSGGHAGQHTAPRGLDPDTVLRLRVAVETCVNQDVRTALRDAIYGELEEETLERALAPNRAAR